jgi:autotransporter translocation and assembly factor TamB
MSELNTIKPTYLARHWKSLVGVGIVILLLIGLRISLKSDWLLEIVRSQAEQIGSETLYGDVTIENISGDLLNNLVVQGVTVTDSLGSQAVYLDTLSVRYSVWSYFSSSFKVNDISLSGAEISVEQWSNERWNLAAMLPPDTTESEVFPLDIDRLNVTGSRVNVRSGLLPDSTLEVTQIEIESELSISETGMSVALRRFDLSIREGRLSSPAGVSAQADYRNGNISLDKLTIYTANSLLNLVAQYSSDPSAVDADASISPLSWRDVAAYTPDPYLLEDLELRLGLSGSLQDLNVNVGVSATGLDQIDVKSRLSLSDAPALLAIEATVRNANLSRVTGIDSLPRIGSLTLSGSGNVPLGSPDQGSFESTLELTDFELDPYRLDRLDISANAQNGNLDAELSAGLGAERVSGEAQVTGFLNEAPEWTARIETSGMNPAFWAADTSLAGNIRGVVTATGQGFEPGERAWEVVLKLSESRFNEIPLAEVDAKVSLTDSEMDLAGYVQLVRSRITATASISDWLGERPSYGADVRTVGLNVAEVVDLPEFSTSLNLEMSVEGSGFDPESVRASGVVRMTGSNVNGAEIDSLTADVTLMDGILVLENSVLESTLARADFRWRQDIFDFTNASNRLDFGLEIGDVGPLAPLLGAELLQASGRIDGTLRTPAGVVRLDFSAALEDLVMDTISVREVDFSGVMEGEETFSFEVDTRIGGVRAGTQTLEDTWFRAFGEIDSTRINGQYRLNINTQNELSVMTLADFEQFGDTLRVRTTDFQLKVPEKQLDLYRPFNVVYDGTLFESDPIYLRGSTGIELTIGVKQTAELAFSGFINARDLDLSMMQHMTPDTVNVQGRASGDIQFDVDFTNEVYQGYAELNMQDFSFEGLVIDEATMDVKLNEGRINARFNAIQNEATLAHIDLDVPFMPGDPSEFDPAFFEQPVVGEFELAEIDLTTQQTFLTWLGLQGTSGKVSASGTLSGQAGSPQFTGEFQYGEGRLSGVPIDHFDFGWQYHDSDEKLALTGRMVSSGQEVAYMYGAIPLKIDWRTFNPVDLGEETNMDLTVKTTSFNLAAVSPFMDQTMARDLSGTVTMDLKITGDPMSPTLRGEFSMQNGRILLVENNVVIRNISSSINFQRESIVLNDLSMQSNGTFRANGEIKIDGFTPGDVAISMRADNFSVYNTRDIQAIVSMNAAVGGRADSPRITGDLNVVRGFIYLDNFGERTVEEVQLDDEEPSAFDGLALWENTAMEFKFGTQRNFWVRNRNRPEIQLQLNGELDLVKQRGQDLEVFGRMGVNDGFVMQLGKRFTFDQGDLVFSGPPTNPQIQIKTLYALRQPSDIKIWYVIGGTAENPEFSYESDPEMELQDIVSYTVFGRPFHSLMAWEQTITGRTESAVADAAVDILLDRVEQIATEQLGIDLLQIDNSRASGNSGTTIKAGKFVSNRLFVAILQELGVNPLSQIIVEYELKKDLDLIITGSDSYHNGVDIRWKYDY